MPSQSARRVLFLRTKQTRSRPSHSSQLTLGRSLPVLGSMRTTEDSTWWGPEVVLADLHDVGDLGPELGVDGEATVERVAGTGGEAEGEFALEHEDRRARGVGHGEEFEDEGEEI